MALKADKKEVFENMPVKKAVLLQIMPAVASQMIMILYNLADTYFVGMLNVPAETAALTVCNPWFIMLTAMSNLFGIGGASAAARSIGSKQDLSARQITSVSFWCGVAVAVAYSLIVLCCKDFMLSLSGVDQSTMASSSAYITETVIIGGPFSIISLLLANLIRAEGRAAEASLGLSLGGIINILLDPFFVLPRFLGLGTSGAGIATALSNFISMLYFLAITRKNRASSIITFTLPTKDVVRRWIGEILSIGFPSAIQFALTVAAIAAQTKFVSHYVTQAVAGLGIAKKLDILPIFFTTGVSGGLLPILAYNHASGNVERRKAALRFGVLICFSFSVICLVVFEIFAHKLSAIFITDKTTIDYAASFLRRMVVAMPMMALCYPLITQFQAMGAAFPALVCSVIRKGVLDIPLLYIMDSIIPLYGCMWVQPIIDIIALITAFCFNINLTKNNKNPTQNRQNKIT